MTNQHASVRLPNSVESDQVRDLTREDAPAPRRCSLNFGSFRRPFLLISHPWSFEISELSGFFVEISQKLAASPDAIGSVVRGPMGCGSAFDWIGMREMNKQ